MKRRRRTPIVALTVLTLAVIVGLILTAGPPAGLRQLAGRRRTSLQPEELVDQRPLETARGLAALATTPDEVDFAQDAVRLADLDVDLAFASALGGASRQPATKPGHEIQKRIDQAQAQVVALEAKLKQLARESAKAKGERLIDLEQQTSLAQAQLDLAKDELADAQQDMQRSSQSVYSQIERLKKEHEETEHSGGKTRPATGATAQSNGAAHSLLARARLWKSLAAEQEALSSASQYVTNKINLLVRRHDALEHTVQAAQTQGSAVENQAAARLNGGQPDHEESAPQAAPAATLSTVHELSQDEIEMADLDRRIQDLRSLNAVYANWAGLVHARESAALRRLIRSVLWIVLTLLIAAAAGWLISRIFDRIMLERKQRMTLRGVTRFSIQALAVLVILLILFGSPNNLFTVLGLAGAGLTVTLKDFVVAFCGWFVLMGRNGIRVGDWIEINGVRGEVVEIGVLRTVLLETGNWTEAGHPTGRQVAFLNSYAVEGYFFNFSTVGQWMWDELPVLIPSGEDPYPLMERIRAAVAAETEKDARMAEEEWQRVAHRSGVKSFTAEPEINLKPGDSGVRLIVRYITRASERYEVRARVSHTIVKMLHHGERLLPPAVAAREPEPAAPAVVQMPQEKPVAKS